jgi:2-iminobutanoate/2-iminopropanoate deaminase
MKQIIATPGAPQAIGPYSQAVVHNGIVYCSGQIPLIPQTGQMVSGGVAEQTMQVLENLKAVLEAAGSGLDCILKTTCYLKDLGEFAAFNQVYAGFFPHDPPARATVEAARLPKDVLVEVDCIAYVR